MARSLLLVLHLRNSMSSEEEQMEMPKPIKEESSTERTAATSSCSQNEESTQVTLILNLKDRTPTIFMIGGLMLNSYHVVEDVGKKDDGRKLK